MAAAAPGLSAGTTARLQRRLEQEQSRQRLPSVAAAVVRDGELVWSGAAGTLDARSGGEAATTDTQYRIGSITKTFVAVEVLRLRDEGLLALDDTVASILSELDHLGPVTLAQLLSQTSGLQAETSGPWWERTAGGDWSSLVASGIELRLTPGTAHHYSNLGYGVLGEVVARRRGTTWLEAVTTGILEPLGMSRTTARPSGSAAPGLAVHPFADVVLPEPEHDGGAMGPAGQLWSTADDLARWAAFLAGRTLDVLAPTSLREMLRPAGIDDFPGQPWTNARGLGWQVLNLAGRRLVGHGGSMPGFLANLRVDVASGDGAVVLMNATSGMAALVQDLLDLVAEHDPRPVRAWSADASQAEQLDLVGEWFWGPYPMTMRLRADGGLQLGEPGVGRGSRFQRGQTAGVWTGLDGYYTGEPLRVVRDDAGHAVALELASFVFTRTPYDPAGPVPGGVDPTGWH